NGTLANNGTITGDVTFGGANMQISELPAYVKSASFTVEGISMWNPGLAAPYNYNLVTYTCKLAGTLKLSEMKGNLKNGANASYKTDFIHVLIPIPTGATHWQYSDGLVNPSSNILLVNNGDIAGDCREVTIQGIRYLELNMQYILSNTEETALSYNSSSGSNVGKVYLNFNDGTNSIQKVYYKFDCTGLTLDNTLPTPTP
ncbi:MAG: hypothetical protein RR230_06400, partial [Oscillospiraceae bacterium]